MIATHNNYAIEEQINVNISIPSEQRTVTSTPQQKNWLICIKRLQGWLQIF